MKTALDTELFPKNCEVVEIPLHNQWVYLIQKNGNSSLRLQQEKDNLAMFTNEQILGLDYVDVYIRNPRIRYVSGVNTYLQHLQRDHPELDYDTCFWFAKHYKFLNTHYLPQFHWLANLSRYVRKDAKIRIRDFRDFGNITEFQSRARISPADQQFAKQLLDNNTGLELWLYLDQILLQLAGNEMTWSEILEYYKTNHQDIIQHVLPQA